MPECLGRAGELLRVAVYVAEPLRDQATQLPDLDPDIQDEFVDMVCSKLGQIEALLVSNEAPPFPLTQASILLARLLQFDLGFNTAWTSKTKDVSGRIATNILKLALVVVYDFAL